MKKKRKKKPFNVDRYFVSFLRRLFHWSPQKKEILEEATQYTSDGEKVRFCIKCNLPFIGKQVKVDHIRPVGRPKDKKGRLDWNKMRDRMLCHKKNLQPLCNLCHNEKSKKERRKK
jgi:hypothetical protein